MDDPNRGNKPVKTAGISKENLQAIGLWLVVLLVPAFLLFRWIGVIGVVFLGAFVVYSGMLVANWLPNSWGRKGSSRTDDAPRPSRKIARRQVG